MAATTLSLPDGITALLFDLDGVLTQTAKVHAAAWKEMFDAFLRQHDESQSPFTDTDYGAYVDGRLRQDGVRTFLDARGITLPEGGPDDPPDADTVHGLGNRKNELLLELVHRDGVDRYEGSVRYVELAKAAGFRRAVVSASRNCKDLLVAAGIEDLFEVRVDGEVAALDRLPGKPAPDMFLAAATALHVRPAAAAVFEDAVAGVEAGRAGDFGWVVGVDRVGQADALRGAGADVVVEDLSELLGCAVIGRDVFAVDPWSVTERGLDLDLLAETESIFALSNGHIGLRGNLDEGEPHAFPGSYLNGFFESVPLPYAEDGYGYPELGQTLIDVTNGKLIRLLVDDEPFDVRLGTLAHHERVLDLRAGVLRRTALWTSPAGLTVRVRSTRLVSFVQRAIAAVCFEVEPIGAPARVVVQSVLMANEPVPATTDDPRAAAALRAPLEAEYHAHHDLEVSLGHRTRTSGLRTAAAIDHVVDGPEGTVTGSESDDDLGRVTVSTALDPGQTLRVVKLLAYGWSSRRSMPALRDQVDAALAAARRTGWDGLVAGQRVYLDDFWSHADVEIEGDDELQQAVRFAEFQVVQAGARAEQRAIPAKGLTGRGYDGHTFWDMETYALPMLTYTVPQAARDALLWRFETLPIARDRAAELGLGGATFPWRTIRGEECSGYWPAGTAGFHVNADIADAVRRYVAATDDTAFEAGPGLALLVETARLWASLGHHDAEGSFRIDGVTGPDEYSAIGDNNVFTNLMAARNLRTAAGAARRYPERAAELDVEDAEIDAWLHAADAVVIPFDDALGVTPQAEGFTRYRKWDFEGTGDDEYPLLLHHPYYMLYSSQVVKQADLVMALYLCGECFDPEQKLRDFDYYEAITVRDSTLSASIQSIVAAEVGHLDLAYDYLRESALVDLRDLAGNTADGLHLASLAGAWLAVVAGFGGMRDHGETLAFAPRLPSQLTRLAFRMQHRGRSIHVELTADGACYHLTGAEALEILHHGTPMTLVPDAPQTVSWPTITVPATVAPPFGRDPLRGGIGRDDGDAVRRPR